MAGIYSAIRRGEWHIFGVKTWNDLLYTTFGIVNLKKFIGRMGFKNAIEVLEDFRRQNNRLPKSTDKGMHLILNAIYRRNWVEFGISKWNDLLLHVFG